MKSKKAITLPSAIDAEEYVLGSFMIDDTAFRLVEDRLHRDVFYSQKHQAVFDAVKTLSSEQKPTEMMSVVQQLKKDGMLEFVDGPFFISQLTDRIGQTTQVEHFTAILLEKYIARELIKRSNEISRKASDESNDVFELLNDAESTIREISDGVSSGEKVRTNKEILVDLTKEIEAAINSDNPITGIPSGIADIDKTLGGWQNDNLIIVAGRPGMGKSGLALDYAENAAKNGYKVKLVTLEMSDKEIMKRRLTRVLNTSFIDINSGRVNMKEYLSKIGQLEDQNLEIWDCPKLSINELRNRARKSKIKNDIDLLIVDYLQLMDGDGKFGGNIAKEIGSISRGGKQIAKECNIPVIMLAQLSRAVEQTADKRPMMSHLRDSGEIEQDADVVQFVYRPEYYGISNFEDGADTHGKGEIINAKNRGGALKKVRVGFDGPRTHFYCLESRNFDDVRNISEHTPYNTLSPNTEFEMGDDDINF